MGIFGCDLLEQKGYIIPEYYCKYSKERISKETAEDICKSNRHKDCADYKKKTALFRL